MTTEPSPIPKPFRQIAAGAFWATPILILDGGLNNHPSSFGAAAVTFVVFLGTATVGAVLRIRRARGSDVA